MFLRVQVPRIPFVGVCFDYLNLLLTLANILQLENWYNSIGKILFKHSKVWDIAKNSSIFKLQAQVKRGS